MFSPAVISGQSLEKKIGRMVMVGFRGMEVTPDNPLLNDVKKYRVGGVVLFDYDVQLKKAERNVRSPEQLRKLTAQLRRLGGKRLLIAIDQEGGRVNRLKPAYGFPPSISADSLGKINHLDSTAAYAGRIAATLRANGINLNLAPVVDLNLNPQNPAIGKLGRSFGPGAPEVTRHAAAFIEAHRKYRVLTALKHFPGHGSAWNDSHLGLADVSATWRPEELQPYRRLIGGGQADVIMTAHVFQAGLDSVYPATLSRRVITGLLREELGFGGVVISDDMQMQAIASFYGFEEALRLAIDAGVDILLFGNNLAYDPGVADRAAVTIKKLVKEGKISRKRINQSYRRIKKLQRRL
jgi:beta-N-acetylhexosaminidase